LFSVYIDLVGQDIGLATDIAEKQRSPLPLGHAAKAIYSEVIEKKPELGTKDFSSVYQYFEKQS